MEIDLGTYKKTYLQIPPQLPPDFNYSYMSNTEHKKMTQAEIKTNKPLHVNDIDVICALFL